MKLACVGWAADSGVGRELIEALWHLPVSSAFVLPNSQKPTRKDLVKIPCYYSEASNPKKEMVSFLDKHKPDTVLTWEVPGSWDFPDLWRSKGIHWVHVVHWDWFASKYIAMWKTADLVAPNAMCHRELKNIGLEATLLPVPVDTRRFMFTERTKAERFISIYAFGGPHDRRSLPEIFEAWGSMKAPPKLTIYAQKKPPEIEEIKSVPGIEVLQGNAPEPWMLYESADVAVQMSRYEGVGVSLLEAQACGVPVVAQDIPPMDEICPDLPVKVSRTVPVDIMGKTIESAIPSVEFLRSRIEMLVGRDISDLSRAARVRVEKNYSWDALLPRWTSMVEGKAHA